MSGPKKDVNSLVCRARNGDGQALDELRSELQLHIPLIVRRVLRAEDDISPMAQRIRAVVRGTARISMQEATANPERLIRRVAARISHSLWDWLDVPRRSQAAPETVRA
jgi:hypothetical protein